MSCTKICCDSEQGKQLRNALKGDFNWSIDDKGFLVLQQDQKKIKWKLLEEIETIDQSSIEPCPLIGSEWVVLNATKGGQTIRFKPGSHYVLQFKENALEWKLDVNSCSVSCKYTADKILIGGSNIVCTKVCCDTKEAKELRLFQGSELNEKEDLFYTIHGDTLTLKQENKVITLQNKKSIPPLLNTSWKAISMYNGHKDIVFSKQYKVRFQGNRTEVELDINTCFANMDYATEELRYKEGQFLSCTRACCDTQSGLAFRNIFTGRVYYTLEKDSLTLRGSKMVAKLLRE